MTARRVTPADLARVLQLMASRPGARKRRRPGDREGYDEWFDGGASRQTADGGQEWRFGDGTRVTVAPGALDLTVLFPDGATVRIQQQ